MSHSYYLGYATGNVSVKVEIFLDGRHQYQLTDEPVIGSCCAEVCLEHLQDFMRRVLRIDSSSTLAYSEVTRFLWICSESSSNIFSKPRLKLTLSSDLGLPRPKYASTSGWNALSSTTWAILLITGKNQSSGFVLRTQWFLYALNIF